MLRRAKRERVKEEEEEEDAASNANGMREIASRFPVSLFSLLPYPSLSAKTYRRSRRF